MILPLDTMRSILKYPDGFMQIIRGQLSKFIASQAQYRWGAGVGIDLCQVDIKITNLCNLRCEMCAQWGKTGYNFGRPRDELSETVPLETYKRVVDELASRHPSYFLWGGEPFLYPNLIPLVAHMKQRRAFVAIASNGTCVKKHAEQLVRLGLDNLMISLDGPAELHDRIRGVPGTFDKLAESMREINRWKKALNTPKPYVLFLMTLTPTTLEHIVSTMEIGEELKTDFFWIYYSWFTTKKLGLAHQQLMKSEFDCDAISWQGYDSDPSRFDLVKLIAEMRRVRAHTWTFPWLALPKLTEEQIPQYFSEPWNTFGNTRCVSPWVSTEIQANGDVATCRDHPDYIVGNIKDEPLLKIFNNAKYRKFRQRLQKKGLLPVCARCCGLMGV